MRLGFTVFPGTKFPEEGLQQAIVRLPPAYLEFVWPYQEPAATLEPWGRKLWETAKSGGRPMERLCQQFITLMADNRPNCDDARVARNILADLGRSGNISWKTRARLTHWCHTIQKQFSFRRKHVLVFTPESPK
jgi:hypothetical protein